MAQRHSPDRSWPWREDFASLDATERRGARYALQMVARCTWLQGRFDDEDFLNPLWALTCKRQILPRVCVPFEIFTALCAAGCRGNALCHSARPRAGPLGAGRHRARTTAPGS